MFSLRSLPARGARRTLCAQCPRPSSRPLSLLTRPIQTQPSTTTFLPRLSTATRISSLPSRRFYSAKSSADSLIEDIQEQYATARDEFEIASEETEKKSVYAEDDRGAAREELDKLKEMYELALKGVDGEEVGKRVGARIRELDNAVTALEESALEHD